MADTDWSPYALTYCPLKCGSIDGTDTEPHDIAIIRALNATYRPPKALKEKGDGRNSLLVARLNRTTTEETLRDYFGKFGELVNVTVVRNIVTGFSQGYGFIEYALHSDAKEAWQVAHGHVIDGRQIIIEFEQERSLEGWIPRRLGGGFGGKKESGQLRFGCRERPFRRPIHMQENVIGSRGIGRHDDNSDRFARNDRVRFADRKRSRSRDRRRSRSRDRKRRRSRSPVDKSRDRRRRTRSRSRSKERSRRQRSRSNERQRGRSRSRERKGRY